MQTFRALAGAFIDGKSRNLDFVRELEAQFIGSIDLQTCEEFDDLEQAFAMYGASTQDHDDKMLIEALGKALPKLEKLIGEIQ